MVPVVYNRFHGIARKDLRLIAFFDKRNGDRGSTGDPGGQSYNYGQRQATLELY